MCLTSLTLCTSHLLPACASHPLPDVPHIPYPYAPRISYPHAPHISYPHALHPLPFPICLASLTLTCLALLTHLRLTHTCPSPINTLPCCLPSDMRPCTLPTYIHANAQYSEHPTHVPHPLHTYP